MQFISPLSLLMLFFEYSTKIQNPQALMKGLAGFQKKKSFNPIHYCKLSAMESASVKFSSFGLHIPLTIAFFLNWPYISAIAAS